jgi:hypothetical protein
LIVHIFVLLTYPWGIKKKKRPKKNFLRRAKYTRGTTQFAPCATLDSVKSYPLTRATKGPNKIAQTFNSEVMGRSAISYRLAPHADSLKAPSPYRLRHSFYTVILPQQSPNVKHFFIVEFNKSSARLL